MQKSPRLSFSPVYFFVCGLCLLRVATSNLITGWATIPFFSIGGACALLALCSLVSICRAKPSDVNVNDIFTPRQTRWIRTIGLLLPLSLLAIASACPFNCSQGLFEIEKSLLVRSFDPLGRIPAEMKPMMLNFAADITTHLFVDKNSEQYEQETKALLKTELSSSLFKQVDVIDPAFQQEPWKVDSARIEGLTKTGFVVVRVKVSRNDMEGSFKPASASFVYKIGIRRPSKKPVVVEIQQGA